MENNFKYFNTFFIIIIFIILIGLFKYFFHEDQKKNNLKNNPQKKYVDTNYIDHILFIPDNYYFIQIKKIDNFNNEYNLLMIKLFNIIKETLKYNINTISINLISLTDLSLISSVDIKNLINNKKLWNLIEKNAKKMHLKINFIYDESTTHPELIAIFKKITNNTNKNNKKTTDINFIFGYNIFSDIKTNFIELIKHSENQKELINEIKKTNIEILLLNNIPPIDTAIIFNNSSINDSLLLHMKNSKIIHLNYSLHKITKKKMRLILKECLLNLHPFL